MIKERQILFSAPMVRALLNGRKRQTRRALKPDGKLRIDVVTPSDGGPPLCPYGQPSDRLWVRETFFAWGRWETRFSAKKGRDEWHFVDMTLECENSYIFDADKPDNALRNIGNRSDKTPNWWKRPAIFMPRAASRINLEITSVRMERLQDISEADAVAEGIHQQPTTGWFSVPGINGAGTTARAAYALLWKSINGPGSWEANPWVWVVEFSKIKE